MNYAVAYEIIKLARTRKGERYGQAIFNAAHTLYPDAAETFCGGEFDPFYDDDKAALFLVMLSEQV